MMMIPSRGPAMRDEPGEEGVLPIPLVPDGAWTARRSIAFTDRHAHRRLLDRNGLRPSRYSSTKDGLVIMASESACSDVPPEMVEARGA